jgi:putative endonuclease
MQEKLKTPSAKNWVVYMVECDDLSLYTGITNNLLRRFNQHCSGKGAKFFNSKQPVTIIYAETGFDRSTASKREFAIKRMSRVEKLAIIQTELNQIATMF